MSCPITPTKRGYGTENGAQMAAEHFNARFADEPEHHDVEPYPCPAEDCGQWHLRTKSNAVRKARRQRKAQAQQQARKAAKRKRYRENLRAKNPEKYREVQRAAGRRYRANVKARQETAA